MNTFDELWKKLARNKKYREEFAAAQVKRGIPFQIRTMLKKSGFPQEELAVRAGLTQGVVSRAANPEYGNLTLNTLIRVAAGFDVAFIGRFVPFSELGRWFIGLSEESMDIKPFAQEDEEIRERMAEPVAHIGDARRPHGRKLNIYTNRKMSRKPISGIKLKGRRRPMKHETYADASGMLGRQDAQNA